MQNLFLVGQVVLGAYFVYSGLMHFMSAKPMAGWVAMKKLPLPEAGVYGSGVVLVLGGLGVMTQMYLTYSYAALIIFLLAAAFLLHNFWAAKDMGDRMKDMVNFQKNIALAAALLMLLAK